MWLSILKYAAKAAVAAGLHDKVLGWFKRKAKKAAEKKLEQLAKKSIANDEKATEVVKVAEEIKDL